MLDPNSVGQIAVEQIIPCQTATCVCERHARGRRGSLTTSPTQCRRRPRIRSQETRLPAPLPGSIGVSARGARSHWKRRPQIGSSEALRMLGADLCRSLLQLHDATIRPRGRDELDSEPRVGGHAVAEALEDAQLALALAAAGVLRARHERVAVLLLRHDRGLALAVAASRSSTTSRSRGRPRPSTPSSPSRSSAASSAG